MRCILFFYSSSWPLERKYGRSPYLETTIFNFPFADDAPQYRADTLRLFEEIKGINTAGQALHPPPTAAPAASRGVLNPSVPHSLNHARASTVAISLRSSIKAGKFEPYTSQYVIEELLKTPDKEKRDKMIGFIDDYRVKILERCDNAETLAAVYVAEGIIPEAYETDALHIAAATVNRLDCIISLNFKHIVRARTIETTELVNYRAGYKKIGIYTPAEVIYEDN